MTDKQLQKQLNTWKKHNPEIYNEIKLLGYEMGVIGISGKVLKRGSNSRKNTFKTVYQGHYGSYTNFNKRITKEMKKEPIEFKKRFNKNQYFHIRKTLKELWYQLWKTVDSKIAREVTVTAENMDIESKIKLIERVLEKEKNSYFLDVEKDVKGIKVDIEMEEFEENYE